MESNCSFFFFGRKKSLEPQCWSGLRVSHISRNPVQCKGRHWNWLMRVIKVKIKVIVLEEAKPFQPGCFRRNWTCISRIDAEVKKSIMFYCSCWYMIRHLSSRGKAECLHVGSHYTISSIFIPSSPSSIWSVHTKNNIKIHVYGKRWAPERGERADWKTPDHT